MCAIKAVSAISIMSFKGAKNNSDGVDRDFFMVQKTPKQDSFVKLYSQINVPVDEQLEKVTNEFCNTPIDKIRERVEEVVSWGSGSLCAWAAASLVVKNGGKVEDPDVKTAVKELLDPR